MRFQAISRGVILVLAFWAFLFSPVRAGAAPTFNQLLIAPKGAVPPKDFSFPDLSGKKRKLSEMKGKVVLLTYFATWCPLCNEEMPKLTRLYEKYKDQGLVVLAVSIDRSSDSSVRNWIQSKKLTFTILHDRNYTSRRTHNVRFVPTIYVLNRDLQLAAWTVGQVDWNGKEAINLIEGLLKTSSSSAHSRSTQRIVQNR
jgi:peroxiredoxin